MADTQDPESDNEPSDPFVAALLDVRQTAIELGAELSLLAEHVKLNPVAQGVGKHPLEGIAKAIDRFAEEVRLLNQWLRRTRLATPASSNPALNATPGERQGVGDRQDGPNH